jgi:hypothetical protein
MERESRRGARGRRLFLVTVAGLYGVSFVLDRQFAMDALELAGPLLYRLAPVLLLVFLLFFVLNLTMRPDWVKVQVGKESGAKGWLIALVGGVLSVGPVYPWYALLKELRDQGMRSGLVSVFLYSRGIKLPLIPIMIHYFGLAFTITLAFYLVLFSLLGGVLLEKLLGTSRT